MYLDDIIVVGRSFHEHPESGECVPTSVKRWTEVETQEVHIPEERGLVPGTPSVQRRDCYRPWENQQSSRLADHGPGSAEISRICQLLLTIYQGFC